MNSKNHKTTYILRANKSERSRKVPQNNSKVIWQKRFWGRDRRAKRTRDEQKLFFPHIIRYRSLNGLVYVQHLWCSLYDILFSFFNYSHRIQRKKAAETNTVWFFYDAWGKLGNQEVTSNVGEVVAGCVISTSGFPIWYLFQSLSHHHAVKGWKPEWKKGIAKRSDASFLTFQNTYFKALLIYFVCGVCKSVHVRDWSVYM